MLFRSVRLSSFVLHQACLNLGHWPGLFILYANMSFSHERMFSFEVSIHFFASMSTLGALAKTVFMITGF